MMSWLKLPIDSTTREERGGGAQEWRCAEDSLTSFRPFTNYYRFFGAGEFWRLVCYYYPLDQGIGSEGLLLWNHLRRLLLTRSKTKVLVERCVETPYYTTTTVRPVRTPPPSSESIERLDSTLTLEFTACTMLSSSEVSSSTNDRPDENAPHWPR